MSKIGLLCIATNKYLDYAIRMLKSADDHFCTDQDVHYFLFTNGVQQPETTRKVSVIPVQHKSWPAMTLERYSIFANYASLFVNCSHLYYCDADMKFVSSVGSEILEERVATIHPGYFRQIGSYGLPYEKNKESLAYVPTESYGTYYAGGFNGGTTAEYLRMATILSDRINRDYSKGIIAKWHDESHMNWYFTMHSKPTLQLSPEYCYPEYWSIPFKKRLIALAKNHSEMQR